MKYYGARCSHDLDDTIFADTAAAAVALANVIICNLQFMCMCVCVPARNVIMESFITSKFEPAFAC
jgi:hypothetical protein